MATREEIEDALRNADASGNKEDATKLADALVALKSKEAMSTPSASGEMPSRPPEDQPPAKGEGHANIPENSGGIVPALYGAVTGIPGGKAAAAGIRTLGGKAVEAFGGPSAPSYTQNRADVEAEATKAYEQNPVVSGAATLATGAASGLALPGGQVATALERSAPLANAARLAVGGAASGASYGAVEGGLEGGLAKGPAGAVEGAVKGATKGAIGGAIAGPVAGVVGKVASKLVTKVHPSIRLLAERLRESPQELQAAIAKFKTDTGHNPTISEIVGKPSEGELGLLARTRSSAGEVFQQAEQAGNEALPRNLAAAIKNGKTTTSTAVQKTRQGQSFDKVMASAHNKPVTLTLDELNWMSREIAPNLPRKLRQRVGAALDAANDAASTVGPDAVSGKLSLRDMETIRHTLRKKAGPGAAYIHNDEARELQTIAGDQYPDYAAGLDEFGRRVEKIKGLKMGRAGVSRSDTEEYLGEIANAGKARRGGAATGMRTDLSETGSPAQALRRATALGEDTGLQRRIAGTLGLPEAARLKAAGAAEAQAAERRANIAPVRTMTRSEESAQDVQRAVEGIAVMGGHTLSGMRVHWARRVMDEIGIRQSTATKLAEAVTSRDPQKVQEVIAALKRARLSDEKILKITQDAARAASTVGGSAAKKVFGGEDIGNSDAYINDRGIPVITVRPGR